MKLFKKIEQKNTSALKKFAKAFYIIWCVLSLLFVCGGAVFTVMFIKSKISLFLILLIICFISAVLFFSIALMQSVTLFAVISTVNEPQKERESEKEFKKLASELVKLNEMKSVSLLDENEFENRKRAVFEKIYLYFDSLGKKEIVSKFLYLTKCGAVSEDKIEYEKTAYFNETQYKKALVLLRGGDYAEARDIFQSLGDYKQSRKMAEKCAESL